MSDFDNERSSSRRAGGRSRDSGEFQQAVDRLEKAVQDVVGSATNDFTDRATSFLNDATARLEREYGDWRHGRREDLYSDSVESEGFSDGSRRGSRDAAAAARMAERRRARQQAERLSGRSRRLYRDVEHQKIGGVCAGIAKYYGVEIWVVRCIAVTGLLFFPSIVFPAYWIAYFVMDVPPGDRERKGVKRGARNHTSPSPELGSTLSPRNSLRNVQADLTEVELRLRRMETHVTSGQYELQRELNRIEEEARADALAAAARGLPRQSP